MKDIESEDGKVKLSKILKELQQAQRWNKVSQQDIKESLGEVGETGDAESGIAGEDHAIIIYNLPWEGLRED